MRNITIQCRSRAPGFKAQPARGVLANAENESELCGSKFAHSSGMEHLHRRRDAFLRPPRAKLAEVKNCKGSKSISG